MRKSTQKQEMKSLTLYLPIATVEAIEKHREYYSVNRWCWRALEKQLEEEQRRSAEGFAVTKPSNPAAADDEQSREVTASEK